MGWRVVPPRVFRRRISARLANERRVQDRLDRAELERHLWRGTTGSRASGDAIAEQVSGARRCAPDQAADATVRQNHAPPGLHPAIPPPPARTRRPAPARRPPPRTAHCPAARSPPATRPLPPPP